MCREERGCRDAGLLAQLSGNRNVSKGSGGHGAAQWGATSVGSRSIESHSLRQWCFLSTCDNFQQGLEIRIGKTLAQESTAILLYTRRCLDNIIVMIFQEQQIGYHLYWGHFSVRYLALPGKYRWCTLLVNRWVATNDRCYCSLLSRASEFCRY